MLSSLNTFKMASTRKEESVSELLTTSPFVMPTIVKIYFVVGEQPINSTSTRLILISMPPNSPWISFFTLSFVRHSSNVDHLAFLAAASVAAFVFLAHRLPRRTNPDAITATYGVLRYSPEPKGISFTAFSTDLAPVIQSTNSGSFIRTTLRNSSCVSFTDLFFTNLPDGVFGFQSFKATESEKNEDSLWSFYEDSMYRSGLVRISGSVIDKSRVKII